MTPEHLLRYDRRVPRYTSYPTAADFTAAVDAVRYRQWLSEIPPGEDLSLYIHIPFCTSLCWFCGCHTTVVNRYSPITAYLALVEREIEMVRDALGGSRRVVHVQWGGGTPTILRPDGVWRLADSLNLAFDVAADAEFTVEVDPRGVHRSTIAALADAGVTRASLGVQDFDPEVQRAINRIQSFDATARVVDWLRAVGIDALNIDLVYGLPGQTVHGLTDTVDRTLALNPNRIALFGYAHVPWMKRHQRLIDETQLPNAARRLEICNAARARLLERGYVAIGLDHFALPSDPLAVAVREGWLRRNFQGYTTDRAAVLIGFGASAIGDLPQGYVQNATRTPDYRAAIETGVLAVVRGIALDAEDRLRRDVIERLMCDLEVDLDEVCRVNGANPAAFAEDLAALAPLEACGAVRLEGRRVRVTPDGRLLLRVVCAAFDRRLASDPRGHALAI
ncbi:MAG: oxygen-independent coproporphyrinogen III oxidase [Proteobacteria bacterium]|nr:oxygen-independent coproporphyrinogen III oxidase [Pseudomonadota bacterium]